MNIIGGHYNTSNAQEMNFRNLFLILNLIVFLNSTKVFANHQGGPLYGITLPIGISGAYTTDPSSFNGYRLVASPPLPFGITYSNFEVSYDENVNMFLPKGTYTHQVLELILLRIPIGSWGFGIGIGGGNVVAVPDDKNYEIQKSSSTSYSLNIVSGAIGPLVLSASTQTIQAKESEVKYGGISYGEGHDSSITVTSVGFLYIF